MIDQFDRLLEEANIDLVHIGAVILRVLMIVVTACVLSHVLRGRIERALAARAVGRNGALLVGRLISLAILVISTLAILGSFGANWTGLLTVLSAGTVAVGLAIQDVLRNFVAGIFLLLERPFRVGDSIRVRDVEGEVQGIDIRTTLVKSAEGSLVMIPNAVVFTEVLTNRSRWDTRRLDLLIEEQQGRSVRDVERAIATALEAVSGVRSPIPVPVIQSIAPEKLILELSIMVDAQAGAETEALHALGEALEGASITVSRS
jgi:small-conductance mechanosensitive channel